MKPCRSRRLILPQPGSRRKQWLQRSSTWKPPKGFQTFPGWFAAGKAGWLPTRDRRHGNPQRGSKPSRDGSQPAKPSGFPRGIVDLETLKGFPTPRWFAAGKAGWLPTRDRRHGNPQRVSKPAAPATRPAASSLRSAARDGSQPARARVKPEDVGGGQVGPEGRLASHAA